ncbi:unnamed protein product [Adineta ricciae]|uniref:NAD(P)(+)--arginine ADP-ribosyltransferase n=1 Tax=Adineta ricciae TaxID=249248 RepID=A0A813U310_ADIRI|nr:unnamed protein product [Adineta ricciae]CAF1241165.1 unnamed protein product [Adineta ricciae]
MAKKIIERRDNDPTRISNVCSIWLDKTIDANSDDSQSVLKQLRDAIGHVEIFVDDKKCVEFLENITNDKICMIISGSFGQHIVPRIHDKQQVDSIFIFCGNITYHEGWVQKWPKVKGVFTKLTSICEALKRAAHESEHNAIPMSFVTLNKRLDQLEPTFMYTQILKEILLTIHFEKKHFNEFIHYCSNVFADNEKELENVERLKKNYNEYTPIWWYTCEGFLYPMLNRALRTMDGNILTRIGFFINDLHRQILQVHKKQYLDETSSQTFTVYRGQGLSHTDFHQLIETKGGLLSFNNFLSTSKTRKVSLHFARQASNNPDLVGILFIITIDPTQSTTPFASIRELSYFQNEDETLFSMHSIFRVHEITPMDDTNRLYQIDLTATNDNDKELNILAEYIRNEVCPNTEGRYKLGSLLKTMGQFDRASEVYEVLAEEASTDSDKAFIYFQLGAIKYEQADFHKAIELYEKSVAIVLKLHSSDHIDLALYYNDIGMVYDALADYSQALSYHEKALSIRQRSLSADHPDLAMSYNNIGMVYDNMCEYGKALESYEKALAICHQAYPSNHPHLAMCYNNLGLVYDKLGDQAQALSSHQRALAIRQQSLPPNHPDLAMSYNNIGTIYDLLGDFHNALSSHEKVISIC